MHFVEFLMFGLLIGALARMLVASKTPGGWGILALASLVLSFVTYQFATALVAEWGENVKSAFDCFLPALATKLGYKMPVDAKSRADIWGNLNGQVLYRVVYDQPPYDASTASLHQDTTGESIPAAGDEGAADGGDDDGVAGDKGRGTP